jgi:hypothetical protein
LRELKLDEIELGTGRPPTEAYIVYLFLTLRGWVGGCKDQQARLLLEESITLKLWLEHLGLQVPLASTLSENFRGPFRQIQAQSRFAGSISFLVCESFSQVNWLLQNDAQMHDFHEKKEKRAMKAPWLEQQKSNR